MNSYYYFWICIFTIIAVMIILDPNVGEFITLVSKVIKVNVERTWWMIKFHPQNPVTNLIKRWEYDKIAKELEKELLENQQQD